jgi:biotin transport system substrate-specific component
VVREEEMIKTALHTDARVAESSSSLIKQAGIVICASAVIAVCARLVLPLPYTPVPLTVANFGVLLIGLTLGSRRGFAAAALYLVWGAVGLPVFSPVGPGGLAQLFGPTAGYLWAYPLVAFVAGWIAERGHSGLMRNLLAGVTGELVLFTGGLSWLAVMTHSWQRAAFFGLYPFLVAELLKVTVAATAALRLRRSF